MNERGFFWAGEKEGEKRENKGENKGDGRREGEKKEMCFLVVPSL